MCQGSRKDFRWRKQLVTLLGTLLAFQLCGLIIELAVVLLPGRSFSPEIFSVLLSVLYVTITSIGMHGTLNRKEDFLKGYAIAMVVTLTVSVIMSTLLAYLSSLGVLMLDPSHHYIHSHLLGGQSGLHTSDKNPIGEEGDLDDPFFLRTNLQVLLHNPPPLGEGHWKKSLLGGGGGEERKEEEEPKLPAAPGGGVGKMDPLVSEAMKRFQFLSILETNTLSVLLAESVGSWIIPTLWTTVQLGLFVLSITTIVFAFEAASDIRLTRKNKKNKL